jgi:DNA helicase HerA-like ATPase
LLRVDPLGRGIINILTADKLMALPKLYATFLLWLLADLYEKLPEVGDIDRPKLVFFFDEAHLLFDGASKVVLEKVEQVVRLIRSKGVGIYFVSQNPLDIPDTVLGQLGNRVQHALRAFTPRDQKAVKAAAQTFRCDGSLDVERVISELAVGEALVSLLDESGSPLPVDRVRIIPPESRLGAIADDDRHKIVCGSALFGRYEKAIDRESAFEMLKARAQAHQEESKPDPKPSSGGRSRRQSPLEAMMNSASRAIGTQLGRELLRGVLGSLLGGSRRR